MRHPLLALVRETLPPTTLIALAVLLVISAPPTVGTHAVAALPRGSPAVDLSRVGALASTWSPGNVTTPIQTTDSATATNTAMNFTLRAGVGGGAAIALAPGENLSITLTELLRLTAALPPVINIGGLGIYATNPGTGTVVYPAVDLPSDNFGGTRTYVDTALALPNPGEWNLRMVFAHNWWWSFTADGQAIGSGVPAWQNGTYDLNTSSAAGYYSTSQATLAPTVTVSETGATLPFPSSELQVVLSPAMIVNTSAAGGAYAPTNGVYCPPAGTSSSCPIGHTAAAAGHLQVSTLGNDVISLNAVGSIASNNTALWGVAPPPPSVSHTWLGAYTHDPTLTNVTGVRLTLNPVPTTLPPSGQVVVHQVVLPVNGTETVYVGFADVYFTSPIPLQGVYPFYIFCRDLNCSRSAFGFNIGPMSSGSHSVSLVRISGWWWQVQVDGAAVTSGWVAGATNGTLELNNSVAWGDNARPFAAGSAGSVFGIPIMYTNQPMISFFGNQSSWNTQLSIAMQTTGGSWGVPFEGLHWVWGAQHAQDVMLGASDIPTVVPAGTVLVENATVGHPSPLSNTTKAWVGTTLVATPAPATVASGGGFTSVTVNVSVGGSPIPNAIVNVSDTGSQQYGHCSGSALLPNPNGAAGSYVGTCWFNASVSANTADALRVTAIPPSSTGDAPGSGTIAMTLTPPLTVDAQLVGVASGGTVKNGASLTLDVWTNVSGAGVATAQPVVAITTGDGTFGAPTTVSQGFYTFALSISSLPQSTSAQVTVAALGATGSGLPLSTPGPTIGLNIQQPLLTISAVTATCATGCPSAVPGGSTVTFSVTVSGGSGTLSGATVTFAATPTLGAGSTANPATTNSAGVATWQVVVSNSLVSQTSYTVTASVKATGYANGNAAQVVITVLPPGGTSPNPTNTSGTSSPLLLYAIIGIVVVAVVVAALVLMLRKKKSPPSSGGGVPPDPNQGPMMEPPPGAPPEGPVQ